MSDFSFKNIVRNVLTESFNDYEYHFTSMSTAYSICKNNIIPLAPTLGKGAERGINGNKMYFMSFTRRRNGNVGYSKGRNVRITFDGNLLNTQFRGKAVDYWGDSMGKSQLYRKLYNYDERQKDPTIPVKYKNDQSPENALKYYHWNKKDNESEDDYLKRQEKSVYNADYSGNESEDRLLTNKPYIENADRYIMFIDILIDPSKQDEIIRARDILFTRFQKKIRIFDNDKDFNAVNGKDINYKFEYKNYDEHGEYYDLGQITKDDDRNFTREDKGIAILGDFFKFISFHGFLSKKNPAGEIKKMLANNGLTQYVHYTSPIIKKSGILRNEWGWDVQEPTYLYRLIQDAYGMRNENGAEIVRFITDWYNSQGFKSQKDFLERLKPDNSKNDTDKYDYNIKKRFLIYGYNILIPSPDTTDFWTVIGYTNKSDYEYFTDAIENYIRDYDVPIRNNNEESFHKYMQHLWRKCSVNYMINLLDKITSGNGIDFINDLVGRNFQYKELNLWDAEYDYYLPGYNYNTADESRKKIKQLFLKNSNT